MPTHRIKPGPNQESVWDYPRPPRAELTGRRVRVVFNGVTLADTIRAYRVLETSHPPGFYIPRPDVHMQYFSRAQSRTVCEFKGTATYWTITVGGRTAISAAWSYEDPRPGFEVIRGYLAFYPGRMDACTVDDEQVTAQAGDFYGGWITSDVVGPFKGAAGSWGW